MDIKNILKKVEGQSPILQLLYIYLRVYYTEGISTDDLIKKSNISKDGIDKYFEILKQNNFFIDK